MTKDKLAQFNSRQIKFTIGGVRFLGILAFDRDRSAFSILYSDLDSGRDRNRVLDLSDILIERITFDDRQEILTLV
jgi:hypothetical protein